MKTTVLLSVTMTQSVLSSVAMISETMKCFSMTGFSREITLEMGGCGVCVCVGHDEQTWNSTHKHSCKRGVGCGRGCTAILRCADDVPACCIVRCTVSDKLTPDCQLTNKHGLHISCTKLCWPFFASVCACY